MTIEVGRYMETKNQTKSIIAFDLGGTSLKYGYGNHDAGLVYFNGKFHKDKTLTSLQELFTQIISDFRRTNNEFSAVSIAAPGIINTESGVILGSVPNLPFLRNVSLKDLLFEISKLPVYVENDANLMTLAESQGCDSRVVLGITIGTGIGTGLVIDKQIFTGENNRAMEAGHIIVVPNGRRCLCGKKGCLEAYASAESMKHIIYDKFPDMRDLTILKILSSDSLEVRKQLRTILDIFAIGIANLIMTLNPGTIYIGGGVIEIESFEFDYLANRVQSFVTSEFTDFEIKRAVHGNKAGTIGAMIYGASRV
jgi:glucokinase